MTTLYRCDVCLDLIDPSLQDDERAVLSLTLDIDGQHNSDAMVDLCEDCRPQSAGALTDWLTHLIETEGPP